MTDGAQAWDAFRSLQPDVVISDWMMPGLTGLELCRKIRAHAAGGYTYFIMVTSQGGLDEILEGMSAAPTTTSSSRSTPTTSRPA